MKKSAAWILAFVVTLASAVYQRRTGPTYPLRGKVALGNETIAFRLPRSADTGKDCEIALLVPNPAVSGEVSYRRFKTDDPWTGVPMARQGDRLAAGVPAQPAAGKLAYRVVLTGEGRNVVLPESDPAVIRFKGQVPAGVLMPHILLIFTAMLCSTRAGLAALNRRENPAPFVVSPLVFMILGGFLFGPIVQKYAFGVFWSGFPLGTDLTDTKMILPLVMWIAALIAGRRGKDARGWILAASIVTLAVYLVPHSLLGSELNYR